MTTGAVVAYVAGLFACYFAGLGVGLAAKFVQQMSSST